MASFISPRFRGLTAVRAAAAVLRSGRQDGNGSERDMLELAKEVANDFYDAIVLSTA